MPTWSSGVSIKGVAGLSVLAGQGAPANTLGVDGQPGYFDTNGRFYGPKQNGAWPTTYIQLAIAGAAGSLPNDLTGNSLVLSPVQGDSNAVQLQILNSAGNAVFSCDGTGNGAFSGTLNVTGQATLPNLNASNVMSSTQTILTLQHVKGALTVDGATTLGSVQASSANITGALQVGTLQASDVETGTVNATGAVNAKTVMATGAIVGLQMAAENLTVGTAADINKGTSKGKFFGDVQILGDTQATTVEATQLAISGTSALSGAVATGALTAPSVAVAVPSSGAATYPVEMTDSSGNVLFAVDGSGNATLRGTLQISGSEASGAINTQALTAASIVNTGDTALQGALRVDGQSTLHAVALTSLTGQTGTFSGDVTVQGTSHLGAVVATDVSTATLESSGAVALGNTLAVTGATTLAALTATSIQGSSLTLSGAATVGGGLSVTGASALQALSATQGTLSSLHVTGAAAIDGTLQAGATTVPALSVQLPSSNGSHTPMTVTDASGNSLFSLTDGGALTIAGQLIVNGGNANGAENFGSVTVSSLLDTGNGEIQGNFKVDGTTSLQAATTAALTAQSLNVTNDSAFGGKGTFTGALSSASLNTGAINSSSLKTLGVQVATDQYGNGGTLTVAVQANLPTTYTSDLHPTSVASSGSVSVGGNLSVSGPSSLASLSVSGGTTLGTTSIGALTAASATITNAASVGGALSVAGALSGTTLSLKTGSNLPIQILDASGNVLLSQDGQGNLDIKGTLSVSGQPTGSANNLGAVSVTSLVDSGSAQIQQNLSVQGTTTLASLSVSGSTTLGTTTLGATTAGALTASSGTFSGAVGVGTTLNVAGTSTLKALTATTVNASSVATSGAVSVGTTLNVTGASTLAALNATQATLTSAQINNNATVGGTLGVTGAASFAANANISGNLSVAGTALISGSTTVPSLSVALPASGASATPLAVSTNSGSSLLSLDGSGNLTVAGNINSAGGTGSVSTGALSCTSLSVQNSATIGQNLTVSGTATLGATTVTSLTNTGTGTVGALLVQLPSSGAAAKPINLLSSAGTSLFSIDTSGNELLAGNLGVTGATSLTTLSTSGAATLNSASVTNALSAATLSTSGAATLNSLTVTNSASVGGNVIAANTAQAARFVATSAGSSSSPMLQYTSTGSTAYTSGIFSESTFGTISECIGGFVTRSSAYNSGPPTDNGVGFVTHSYYTALSGGGNTAFRWYVNKTSLVMSLSGGGALSIGGALGVGGLTTTAGLSLSSGVLTFADGTTLSSATVQNQAAYTAASAGTAAAPAFRFSGGTNPSGLFFDTTPGNVNVSVNGFKSLYSTAASGAAQGANGWAIASTFGAGSTLLALYGGGSTTAPVWAVDGAGAVSGASQTLSGASAAASFTATGNVTGAGLTISASGGKLTFGDGTSMTTAATGSGGSSTVPQMRYGTGAPTSTNPSTQNDGDFYYQTDQTLYWGPRTNGVWPSNPVNLLGPAGPAGFTSLPNATIVPGPCVLINNLTVSSTTQVIPVPGTTNIPQTYFPQGPSALMGVGVFTSGVACSIELYDQTLSKSIYTQSIPANTYSNTGTFTTTQYPMVSGNQHVWRVTGSGSVSANIQPYYLSASTTNTPALSTVGGFTTAPSTAFTSTAIDILSFGQSSAKQRNVVFIRTASLVGLIGVYVPSAAGAAAATVTITVGSYNYNTGTATTLFTTTNTLTNNSVTTILGQWTPGTYTFAPGTLLYMRVQGSGTGQVNVDAQVVM